MSDNKKQTITVVGAGAGAGAGVAGISELGRSKQRSDSNKSQSNGLAR